jgi:uncharacterized protein (DUF952 family)
MRAPTSSLVVKLLRPAEWEMFVATGAFAGSADDRRDGFIHLSTPEQMTSTVAKWFAGEAGIIAVTFDAHGFGEDLRWETSGNGALFPHLYRPLQLSEVVSVMPAPPLPV